MNVIWPLAGRLLPLAAPGIFLAAAIAVGGKPSARAADAVTVTAAACLAAEDVSWSVADLAEEEPRPLARKFSLRKASRRIPPLRSVHRPAADAILRPASSQGSGRSSIGAAVLAANAADISRLCRRLL